MTGKWVICQGVMRFPVFVGRIESESSGSYFVTHSENQLYSSDCWDKDYVEVFESWKDAVTKFALRKGIAVERELNRFRDRFPSFTGEDHESS
jgi:hypothetical protein